MEFCKNTSPQDLRALAALPRRSGFSQAALAKYQLTKNFPIICKTDTHAAAEKMFKGKQVFSRNFQAVC
jgi:hypothetical protein